jgi:hypothetical protein
VKKIAWFSLFALFALAATFTVISPSAEEACCKKTCLHGATGDAAELCCKKGCHKK